MWWSEAYDSWLIEQWWFWLALFVGSFLFGLLGQYIVYRLGWTER